MKVILIEAFDRSKRWPRLQKLISYSDKKKRQSFRLAASARKPGSPQRVGAKNAASAAANFSSDRAHAIYNAYHGGVGQGKKHWKGQAKKYKTASQYPKMTFKLLRSAGHRTSKP